MLYMYGGGEDHRIPLRSCDTFSKTRGTWIRNIYLQYDREQHTSWNVPEDGGVLIVGGFHMRTRNKTELVHTIDGISWQTKPMFDLKHDSL